MSGARDYAEALLSLSDELGAAETVLSDVKICNEILLKNPEYISLTDTPAISVPEKLALIDRAFSSVNELVMNLLKILSEKHSVCLFPKIATEFFALYNESRGISEAEVISAVPLSPDKMAALKKKLEAMTGKTIILKNTTDKSLLGGVKLRYEGRQLDSSLRSRFEAIEKSLKNTIL